MHLLAFCLQRLRGQRPGPAWYERGALVRRRALPLLQWLLCRSRSCLGLEGSRWDDSNRCDWGSWHNSLLLHRRECSRECCCRSHGLRCRSHLGKDSRPAEGRCSQRSRGWRQRQCSPRSIRGNALRAGAWAIPNEAAMLLKLPAAPGGRRPLAHFPGAALDSCLLCHRLGVMVILPWSRWPSRVAMPTRTSAPFSISESNLYTGVPVLRSTERLLRVAAQSKARLKTS